MSLCKSQPFPCTSPSHFLHKSQPFPCTSPSHFPTPFCSPVFGGIVCCAAMCLSCSHHTNTDVQWWLVCVVAFQASGFASRGTCAIMAGEFMDWKVVLKGGFPEICSHLFVCLFVQVAYHLIELSKSVSWLIWYIYHDVVYEIVGLVYS